MKAKHVFSLLALQATTLLLEKQVQTAYRSVNAALEKIVVAVLGIVSPVFLALSRHPCAWMKTAFVYTHVLPALYHIPFLCKRTRPLFPTHFATLCPVNLFLHFQNPVPPEFFLASFYPDLRSLPFWQFDRPNQTPCMRINMQTVYSFLFWTSYGRLSPLFSECAAHIQDLIATRNTAHLFKYHLPSPINSVSQYLNDWDYPLIFIHIVRLPHIIVSFWPVF